MFNFQNIRKVLEIDLKDILSGVLASMLAFGVIMNLSLFMNTTSEAMLPFYILSFLIFAIMFINQTMNINSLLVLAIIFISLLINHLVGLILLMVLFGINVCFIISDISKISRGTKKVIIKR